MLLMKRFYTDDTPGAHHLFAEGTLAALGGTVFGLWLFPDEVSLVAVFLASITTTDSIERILEANRRHILEEGVPPARANGQLTLQILAMFAGTVLGFSVLALYLPLDMVNDVFSHQLQDVGYADLATVHFGSPVAILLNNIYVLLFFFMIAMPFRQGGVMLAVAWNASVWGAVFGVLARRWANAEGAGLVEAYARVIAAVMPHMMLEAFAYVLAGFAGVFLSKGLLKYDIDSDVLLSISKTVVVMLLLGAFFVGLGALWEGNLATPLVRWFSTV